MPIILVAQKKLITLDDIYKNGTFESEVVPGFSEVRLSSIIHLADVRDETGRQLKTTDYQLSHNRKRVIFFTDREAIYRRSSKANAYLFDAISKKTIRLNDGKIMHDFSQPALEGTYHI